MPADIFYEPNGHYEYSYTFGTHSNIQDYIIYIEKQQGNFDISKYLTVSPTKAEQVPPNSAVDFKVNIDFLEEKIPPGRHEALVVVKETQSSGGQINALAEVAIRFRVTVLYPTEFLNWGFKVADANIGGDVTLKASLTNWGVPKVDDAIINYKIYDSDNQLIKEINSQKFLLKVKKILYQKQLLIVKICLQENIK